MASRGMSANVHRIRRSPSIASRGPVRFGMIAALLVLAGAAAAAQVTIDGPDGSGEFERTVTVLPNGSFVVTDPGYDASSPIADVGAVYRYRPDGTRVSTLTGSSANDRIGGEGVVVLANGNFVVLSSVWDNGVAVDAGAVTFGSRTSGIIGVVSAANSLIGSAAGDFVGGGSAPSALGNGNHAVDSAQWDNGPIDTAGAITLGLANGSVVGLIISTHSVLGAVAGRGSSQVFGYDAARNPLAVGQPASNRVVLQRTGTATTISIIGDTPDPSLPGQPVTFTATVSATPNAPADGQVTFTASSGESCVDTSPTPITATIATFSCTIAFATAGTASVIAEYTGSIIHAYSGIDAVTHTTVAVVIADGFEGP